MKIYEIPVAIRMVFDEAYVDEETGELIFDAKTFAEVCEDAEDKIANTARYLREQEAEIEAMKQAAKDITERARAKANKLDWLKRITLASLEALGKPVEEADIRVTTRKSTKVEVDESILHSAWYVEKVERKPNLRALTDALKQGVEIKGAHLVTNLNLSIK